MVVCGECGAEFEARRSTAQFCSNTCGKRNHRKRTAGPSAQNQQRRSAEREAKLAEVRRLVDEGRMTIRQAEPGELDPPKRRSVADGKRELDRGHLGGIP
jgi:predicted  nucleic acid-binding Zn-ribbon protein